MPRCDPTNGKVMLVSPLQPENALDPMLVTLDGIVTEVRPLQPSNALDPMLVTDLPFMVRGIISVPIVLSDTAG